MRKLYPTNTNNTVPTIVADTSDFATKQALDEAKEQIALLNQALVDNQLALEDYKQQILTVLTTNNIIAKNATLTDAEITTLTNSILHGNIADFNRLTVANHTTLNTVEATSVQTDSLTANSGVFDTVNVQDLAVSGVLTAPSIDVDSAIIDDFNVGDLTTETLDTEALAADNGTIQTLSSTDITAETIAADEMTIEDTLVTPEVYSDVIYNRYFNHSQNFNRMVLDDISLGADEDWWMILPQFTNGHYYVIAREEHNGVLGPFLWSLEVNNSINNINFNWSVSPVAAYLNYTEFVDGDPQYLLVKGNLHGKQTVIYYQCTDFNTQSSPVFYGVKPVDGSKHFDIIQRNGQYLPNSIFAGTFHADSILIDDVQFEAVYIKKHLYVASSVDPYGEPLSYTAGEPGMYLTPAEDNYGNPYLQWIEPKDYPENTETLITAKGVFSYNGRIQIGTDEDDNPIYVFPITYLGDGTEVKGDLTVDGVTVTNGITDPHFYTGLEDDIPDDLIDDALIVTEESISRKRGNDRDPIIPVHGQAEDQKPVIYDQATDSLQTTDSLTIDDINVDTLRAGEAFIDHLHYVDEETVVSSSDTITLRANNSSPLATGQVSGIIINKYNGTDDLALVADVDGTLRVGTGTGTATNYTDVAYKNGTWYEYDGTDYTVLNPQPSGSLTSWTGKENRDDYTYYATATFTVIDKTSLEPVLARDEAANMTDQGILTWDADDYEAKTTVPVPTVDESVLTASIDDTDPQNPVLNYVWTEKQAGVYHFATRAAYDAYTGNIPNDSLIVIDEPDNNVMGDYIV